VLSFFSKRKSVIENPLHTDIHSHLLAAIDDGVKNWEEAETVLRGFLELGFKRIITTPHIMSDTYPNKPSEIIQKHQELKKLIAERKIEIDIQAAAEYYLDENLFAQITKKESLLTFGDRYLLFETNFVSEPLQLKEFIFQATSQGYRLILAHPERYGYMTMAKAEDLRNRGVLFQLNTLSIVGYYSSSIQKMARKFIEKGWVDFLGSDCHNPSQALALKQAWSNKYVQRAMSLPLLNNTI
jgi:tyrosine-protein phosphatase YwqE